MRALTKAVLGRIVRLLPPSEVLDGYDNPEVIEALYTRACEFTPMGQWDEFKNRVAVLDFGGGFGQHYRCAITLSPAVRWAVVETVAMARRASALATPNLRFFASISAAVEWLGEPDLVHSNGALHYTPDPAAVVKELCSIGAPEMLWGRVFLSPTDHIEIAEQLTRLDENGPRGSILDVTISRKLVRNRVTKMPEANFLACHTAYRIVERNGDCFRFVR